MPSRPHRGPLQHTPEQRPWWDRSAADRAKAAVGDATTPTNGWKPALACSAVEAQKVKLEEVEVRQVDAQKVVEHVVHR